MSIQAAVSIGRTLALVVGMTLAQNGLAGAVDEYAALGCMKPITKLEELKCELLIQGEVLKVTTKKANENRFIVEQLIVSVEELQKKVELQQEAN